MFRGNNSLQELIDGLLEVVCDFVEASHKRRAIGGIRSREERGKLCLKKTTTSLHICVVDLRFDVLVQRKIQEA
jgi:hypothetical protein